MKNVIKEEDFDAIIQTMIESNPERYGGDDGTYYLMKDLNLAPEIDDESLYIASSVIDNTVEEQDQNKEKDSLDITKD